jgi:hypothetical protein
MTGNRWGIDALVGFPTAVLGQALHKFLFADDPGLNDAEPVSG